MQTTPILCRRYRGEFGFPLSLALSLLPSHPYLYFARALIVSANAPLQLSIELYKIITADAINRICLQTIFKLIKKLFKIQPLF
jgi:hypothetical protein